MSNPFLDRHHLKAALIGFIILAIVTPIAQHCSKPKAPQPPERAPVEQSK